MLVTDILNDLRRFQECQDEIKAIHDRWCGPGAFVHEAKTPLDSDVYHGVLDALHLELGQYMAESYMTTLLRISRQEAKKAN